jgi:fatty-acyl-CoA synthase
MFLQSIRKKAEREVRTLATYARLIYRIRHAKAGRASTVCDLIEQWVDKRPDAVALVDGDRQLTYRELDAYANRVARWAQNEGVGRGDVVALMMTNRLEYVCTWLGVLKVGGVCALLNYQLRSNPLAHCVKTSTARHVIVGGEVAEEWLSAVDLFDEPPAAWVQNAPGKNVSISGARDLDEELDKQSGAPLPADIREGQMAEETALYLFTSGTTGLPKAANISHIRALNFMHAFAVLIGSNETDRVYVALPLYHATAGLGGVGAALSVGGCLVMRDRFSAKHFWSDIVAHDCTMFIYIGELCRYLVNTPEHPDEGRHRIRACMGNGLRPEVWIPFRDRFALPHIVEGYGSSEGNVAFFNIDDKVGSVGRLPPYMEVIFKVKVVEFDVEREEIVRGPDGHCIECAHGDIGEVIGLIDPKKPGGRFDGYADAAATKKKILENAFESGDRWFRTGDLLRRDAEGYYYFIDRIGDTFRWKGENVATSEVGEVLAVMDTIADANVYGVEVAGTDGRAGMAAVVINGELDLDELYGQVSRELAGYARPLFLRRLEKMDVTGTFKHRKADLVRDGFDPSATSDPLYLRDDANKTYVPLTPELYESIISGSHRV